MVRLALVPRVRRSLLAGCVVIATVAGAAGIAADAAGASAAQAVSLGYTCASVAGSYKLGVQIAATVASGTRIGRTGPVSLRVTVLLPRAVLGTYSGPFRAAELLTVTESGPSAKPVTVTWPAGATGSVPRSSDLPLTTSGTIRPVATSRPGQVTFQAGRLSMAIYLGKGAIVRASCRPDGAAVTFASATVNAAAKSGIPAGCGRIKVTGTGVPTCAYVTGYSDVAKLIGAALLQPPAPAKQGLVNVAFAEKATFKPGVLIEKSAARLLYRGRPVLPPITATFLAFRFVPVSATLHLTELTTIAILSKNGDNALPYPVKVRTSTKISLRVTNVRVNGVPLNVGADCRTASPITLVLIGTGQNQPLRGYTVQFGGPLLGEATVPPFTGCGVRENLDPLLTGSISGRGNFVRFIQAQLCAPSQQSNYVCPPPAAKPSR